MDKNYEKEKAKEMLALIDEYTNSSNKKLVNEKLNKLADELYYKNKHLISQKMIDVSLAVHSFTQAAMTGGHFQDLDEFVPDLEEISS